MRGLGRARRRSGVGSFNNNLPLLFVVLERKGGGRRRKKVQKRLREEGVCWEENLIWSLTMKWGRGGQANC